MTARTLTLKYRPKVLADIVGQEHVTSVVRAMVLKDKLPPALIFSGPSGTGKTTTARVLAAALNCENTTEGEPCGECAACLAVWTTSNSSVIEIDAASKNSVDAVKSLRELTFFAHTGKWRVVLLDEAHSMSEEAFNALLKIMEEPPENTVFILLTTEAYKILHTVDTRAMGFEFRRIAHNTIVAKLQAIAQAEDIAYEPAMLEEIAKQSKGSLREAIMHLDQASLVAVQTAQDYRDTFGVVDVAGDIVRAALNGDKHTVMLLAGEAVARVGDANYLISDLLELLRDLVALKAGGVPPCLPAQMEERKSLAHSADPAAVIAALKVLWASRDKVRTDTDQLTAAQVTCALVADALFPEISKIQTLTVAEPMKKVEETTERPLTLAEMMAKMGAPSPEA